MCHVFNVEEEVVVIRNGWTPKKKEKKLIIRGNNVARSANYTPENTRSANNTPENTRSANNTPEGTRRWSYHPIDSTEKIRSIQPTAVKGSMLSLQNPDPTGGPKISMLVMQCPMSLLLYDIQLHPDCEKPNDTEIAMYPLFSEAGSR